MFDETPPEGGPPPEEKKRMLAQLDKYFPGASEAISAEWEMLESLPGAYESIFVPFLMKNPKEALSQIEWILKNVSRLEEALLRVLDWKAICQRHRQALQKLHEELLDG